MRQHKIVIALFVLVILFGTRMVEAKDRALLIGIDFYNLASDTPGSTTDAKTMEQFLITKLNFAPDSIHKLLNQEATAANIKNEFQRWLIDGSSPGDRIFFHYSGHGARVPDENGDEKDGWDEAITPYDVTFREPILAGQPVIPGSNFISDDNFGEWIGMLAGRRVVMVFDSCHSGTISRSAGNKKPILSRFLRARNAPQSRSFAANDVYSPTPTKGRDIAVIKEDFLDGTANNVVIFSSAGPDQEALPILTPTNGYVGAFTYLFTEKQKNGLPTLGQLSENLKRGMVELKDKGLLEPGRNGQYQLPQVDIISTNDLNGQPLFGGNWEAAPEAAMANPLSTIKLKIQTGGNRKSFKINDLINFKVTTDTGGYLYVVVFSENNVASCLFPSNSDKDNRVSPGTFIFPRGSYEFYAQEPIGRDVWVALLTDKPVSLGDKDNYSWDEVFARIGLQKLQETVTKYSKNRGAGTRPIINSWQATTMVVEVKR